MRGVGQRGRKVETSATALQHRELDEGRSSKHKSSTRVVHESGKQGREAHVSEVVVKGRER